MSLEPRENQQPPTDGSNGGPSVRINSLKSGHGISIGWFEQGRKAPWKTGSTRHPRLADKLGRGYLESMSEQTVQLLDAFEALPSDDKQAFAVEIMRRPRELPFDSGPITDEEIGEAGKAMFALLDQEENAAHTR